MLFDCGREFGAQKTHVCKFFEYIGKTILDVLLANREMDWCMLRELFISKARSATMYGAEIWMELKFAAELDKVEAKVLRIILNVHRRPKSEALWWLLRLLPWSSEVLCRKLKFVIFVITAGPQIEKDALTAMQQESVTHSSGWWHELLRWIATTKRWCDLKRLNLLTPLEKSGIIGVRRLKELVQAVKLEAIDKMRAALAGESSKHEWMLALFPVWTAKRPWRLLSFGAGGTALRLWLLRLEDFAASLVRSDGARSAQTWWGMSGTLWAGAAVCARKSNWRNVARCGPSVSTRISSLWRRTSLISVSRSGS